MSNRGVIYACSHDTWLGETIRSALSVKKVMPDLERRLYITENLLSDYKQILESAFTKVIPLQHTIFRHRPRLDACIENTLDRAIFIDSDTLILQPLDDLFQVLDDFDIALCLAPQLHHSNAIDGDLHSHLPLVSMALAEFNAGLIVANNTAKFRTFIRSWMQLFKICLDQKYAMDQVALRVALAKSELRIATLPNNYNFRVNVPQSVAGMVKILHGHGELEEIAKFINQQESIRLYAPPAHLIHGMKPRKNEAWRGLPG